MQNEGFQLTWLGAINLTQSRVVITTLARKSCPTILGKLSRLSICDKPHVK